MPNQITTKMSNCQLENDCKVKIPALRGFCRECAVAGYAAVVRDHGADRFVGRATATQNGRSPVPTEAVWKPWCPFKIVVPAKAETQSKWLKALDSRLRGNDEKKRGPSRRARTFHTASSQVGRLASPPARSLNVCSAEGASQHGERSRALIALPTRTWRAERRPSWSAQ